MSLVALETWSWPLSPLGLDGSILVPNAYGARPLLHIMLGVVLNQVLRWLWLAICTLGPHVMSWGLFSVNITVPVSPPEADPPPSEASERVYVRNSVLRDAAAQAQLHQQQMERFVCHIRRDCRALKAHGNLRDVTEFELCTHPGCIECRWQR